MKKVNCAETEGVVKRRAGKCMRNTDQEKPIIDTALSSEDKRECLLALALASSSSSLSHVVVQQERRCYSLLASRPSDGDGATEAIVSSAHKSQCSNPLCRLFFFTLNCCFSA